MTLNDRQVWIIAQLEQSYPDGLTGAELATAGYPDDATARSNDLYKLKAAGRIGMTGGVYSLITAPERYNQQLREQAATTGAATATQTAPDEPETVPVISVGLGASQRTAVVTPTNPAALPACKPPADSAPDLDSELQRLALRLNRVQVRDLERKTRALKKLAALMDPTIADLLQQIAHDLEAHAA